MNGIEIEDLSVSFAKDGGGQYRAIRRCTLSVARGEVVGLVGESGCGKSLTALAAIGLLPAGARAGGSVRINGAEVLGADDRALGMLRGRRVAMIFQNPMSALNPFFTVGQQIGAVIRHHFGLAGAELLARVARSLERVQLPAASAARYPHQMSGGQLQRAMIAMAVACEPDVLIADEPTTALDVTVQARIMELLRELTAQGMGLLLITHDLALVAQAASRVYVMYAGRIVESGPVHSVFGAPAHPYTDGLLRTRPWLGMPQRRLPVIEGRVPAADMAVTGCAFRERCPRAGEGCDSRQPQPWMLRTGSAGRMVECHFPAVAGLKEAQHEPA